MDPWAKDSLVVKLDAQSRLPDGRTQWTAQFDIALPDRRADPS